MGKLKTVRAPGLVGRIGKGLAFVGPIACRQDWQLLLEGLAKFNGQLGEKGVDRVPSVLVEALMAAEDRRFFQHSGVDPIAVGRAISKVWVGKLEGASTIEQQLVRRLTGRYERTIRRKLREMLLAWALSGAIPKHEIARLYLSLAYFGWQMNGLEQACRRLNISLERMTLEQAAAIVARLKYPEPRVSTPARAARIERRQRQIVVLLKSGRPERFGEAAIELEATFSEWSDEKLLTACLWAEAVHEPEEGLQGICNVVLNRVKKGMGSGVREVILTPRQFSWTNPENPNLDNILSADAQDPRGWERARRMAGFALCGLLEDNTGGADHYLNVELAIQERAGLRKWAEEGIREGKVTAVIGSHTFLNLRGQSRLRSPIPDRPSAIVVGSKVSRESTSLVSGVVAPRGLEGILRTFGDIYEHIRDDGSLDRRWEYEQMRAAKLPFAMPLSFDGSRLVKHIYCHKELKDLLPDAFREIERKGLRKKVKTFGGCFNFRFKRGNGSRELSVHSWGIAIDLNPETNGFKTVGDMDPEIVAIFESFGFTWGGSWSAHTRDPMHFQFCSEY